MFDPDDIRVRTSCGRRDMMIAAMGKDTSWIPVACLWTLVALLVIVLGIGLYNAFQPARDSQGVPCTISTAQNADGTPECQ